MAQHGIPVIAEIDTRKLVRQSNAQHSTGPKTDTGKAIASNNRFRAGHHPQPRETLAVDDPKQLALLLRYQTTHDRAFHKSLDQLLKLRAEKRKAQIGSESQEQKKGAETRKQELHKWAVSLAEAKLDRQLLRNATSAHAEIAMETAA